MKKLKLPKIKKSSPQAKTLSMDEYFEFVRMHFRFFPRKVEDKKQTGVNVPFVLK